MDHFYAFLIFAVLVVLENMAEQSWLAPYYRLGIPIFFTRRPLKLVASPDPKTLAKAMETRFTTTVQHPSIRFKALPGRGLLLAFHEALFENRRGVRYLPVMHSLARVDAENQRLSVIGWLDWYVMFTLGYLLVTSLADTSFIPIAVVVLLLFSISYFSQSALNRRVAEQVAALDPL